MTPQNFTYCIAEPVVKFTHFFGAEISPHKLHPILDCTAEFHTKFCGEIFLTLSPQIWYSSRLLSQQVGLRGCIWWGDIPPHTSGAGHCIGGHTGSPRASENFSRRHAGATARRRSRYSQSSEITPSNFRRDSDYNTIHPGTWQGQRGPENNHTSRDIVFNNPFPMISLRGRPRQENLHRPGPPRPLGNALYTPGLSGNSAPPGRQPCPPPALASPALVP